MHPYVGTDGGGVGGWQRRPRLPTCPLHDNMAAAGADQLPSAASRRTYRDKAFRLCQRRGLLGRRAEQWRQPIDVSCGPLGGTTALTDSVRALLLAAVP